MFLEILVAEHTHHSDLGVLVTAYALAVYVGVSVFVSCGLRVSTG